MIFSPLEAFMVFPYANFNMLGIHLHVPWKPNPYYLPSCALNLKTSLPPPTDLSVTPAVFLEQLGTLGCTMVQLWEGPPDYGFLQVPW